MQKGEFESLTTRLNKLWAALCECARRYRRRYSLATNPKEVLPRSQTHNLDDLREAAEDALPLLKKICGRVADDLGGRFIANVKSCKRIEERLKQGIHLGDIEDPVRATIIFKSLDQMAEGLNLLLDALKEETPEHIRVEDYYADPLDYGYIGLQVETLLPASIRGEPRLIRAEIQIHTDLSLEARETVHRSYEGLRSQKDTAIFEEDDYKAYLQRRLASMESFVNAFRKML